MTFLNVTLLLFISCDFFYVHTVNPLSSRTFGEPFRSKTHMQASCAPVPHELSTVMHKERDSIFINWVINKSSLLSLCCYASTLASCLSPARVRVKQSLFGVSSTEWLLLAALQPLWKPVSFPQASQSFRNRWGPGSYLFLRYYLGPKESKRHNMPSGPHGSCLLLSPFHRVLRCQIRD